MRLYRRHPGCVQYQLFLGAFVMALFFSAASAGAEDWSFEILGGLPVSLSATLDVQQENEPDISFHPAFETEPWTPPVFYSLRLSGKFHGTWALELMHHKLITDAPGHDVQHFEITHGFNLCTLQRFFFRGRSYALVGAGLVVAHPDNRVRGEPLPDDSGYALTGPAFTAGAGRRFELGRHVFATLEGRLTWGRAEVPVASGTAVVKDLSGHLLMGAGFSY